ncbi:unnamed protein product [Pleuronectes platessa]|uniref:Uncharacterized protein n=1 Tax=Pleuronectes platessa TaxID=8262 RepID=A0A9N7YS93_PLEPL|nr:unnamed protein product [Pleuronectes platessa]
MAARTLVVACALFLGLCIIASSKPADTTHAYCKIVWLLALPCNDVHMAVVTQIKTMASYKLGSVTPMLIQADHTSGVRQVEHVNFTMIPTAMDQGCHVEGSSMSEFWYSLLDNGTNYCNLHSVMQGSGLTNAPGFEEFTNEWLCLGFGLSTCK